MQRQVERPWAEIRSELLDSIQHSPLSTISLAKAAGVTYYAIWRYRNKGVINRGRNALKLCKYFGIKCEKCKVVHPTNNAIIMSAVAEAWDGSVSHAQLIAQLIRGTSQFIVSRRRGRGRKPSSTKA